MKNFLELTQEVGGKLLRCLMENFHQVSIISTQASSISMALMIHQHIFAARYTVHLMALALKKLSLF
jgi:hypothetical protein